MTGKVYFILASTFFMGMFAGAYLYVTAFAPSYDAGVSASENIDEDTLVIEGQMYGGCARRDLCASFRLIDGRKYHYLPYPTAEVQTGTLPSALAFEVREITQEDVLLENAQRIQSGSCNSYVDGADFSYTVSKDSEEYELDTCTTAFAYDDASQTIWSDVWLAMENPGAVEEAGALLDFNLLRFIIGRF